jgi:hypothetical protein
VGREREPQGLRTVVGAEGRGLAALDATQRASEGVEPPVERGLLRDREGASCACELGGKGRGQGRMRVRVG